MIPALLMDLSIAKFRSNNNNFSNRKKNVYLKDSVIKLTNLLVKKNSET